MACAKEQSEACVAAFKEMCEEMVKRPLDFFGVFDISDCLFFDNIQLQALQDHEFDDVSLCENQNYSAICMVVVIVSKKNPSQVPIHPTDYTNERTHGNFFADAYERGNFGDSMWFLGRCTSIAERARLHCA